MIIKNDKYYNEAVNRLNELMEANVRTNSTEFFEMEALALLISHYENKKIVFPELPLNELIKNHLINIGLQISDFSKIVGHRGIASEILSGKRRLSLNLIKKIHDALGIPYEILLSDENQLKAA